MGEPRIHFALNCASVSCPPLLREPFRSEVLEQQLERVAADFVNHPTRNSIDMDQHQLRTVEIFSWFGEDFILKYGTEEFAHLSKIEAAALNFVYQYLDSARATAFDRGAGWTVEYMTYDWSLNDI